MDNNQFKNHPVEVKGMRIDWIINHDQKGNNGKKFLEGLLNAQNLEIFECETIVAIVEFLYDHYSRALIKERLPFYIIQLCVFYGSIFFSEELVRRVRDPSVRCSADSDGDRSGC